MTISETLADDKKNSMEIIRFWSLRFFYVLYCNFLKSALIKKSSHSHLNVYMRRLISTEIKTEKHEIEVKLSFVGTFTYRESIKKISAINNL